MIPFEEAVRIVRESSLPTGQEAVTLPEADGRVLAVDVRADMDMPPFDKSAVDGFACRMEDLPGVLNVIETVAAGQWPGKKTGPSTCIRIMTGAPMPEGADVVIQVEDIIPAGDEKIEVPRVPRKINICRKAEDIRNGTVVLFRGTLLDPQHIAVLATLGETHPMVAQRVRVAIISTGDELVEPDRKPGQSQIRNSNAWQLIAQVQRCGAISQYLGIAADAAEDIRKSILKAREGNRIILMTGGVSMGDFDHVPDILNDLKAEILFNSIAVQPGKPTLFARLPGCLVFGLPGNPVSSFIQFEMLVKPLIYNMMGHEYNVPSVWLPMAEEYRRKFADRMAWIPVRIDEEGRVVTVEYHGSAHINSLTEADGLISLPVGRKTLEKGERVHVRQI